MRAQSSSRSTLSQRLLAGFWIGPWLWNLQELPTLPPSSTGDVSVSGVVAARGGDGSWREPTPAEMAELVRLARLQLGLRREQLAEKQGSSPAGGVRVDLPPDLGTWLVGARDALGQILVECAHAEAAGEPAPEILAHEIPAHEMEEP